MEASSSSHHSLPPSLLPHAKYSHFLTPFIRFTLIKQHLALHNTLFLSLQQPSPYMPTSVSSLPVPHPSVSPSAVLPPAAPMSSITSFPPSHPPGPTFSIPPASATPLAPANMSTASPAAPYFSDAALSFPVTSDPVSVPAFSCAPDPTAVPICIVSGPNHSSELTVPSSAVAPPVVSVNPPTDPLLRFTFDELNLPDLYASFKSLFRTVRERGGSQCKWHVCICVLTLYSLDSA